MKSIKFIALLLSILAVLCVSCSNKGTVDRNYRKTHNDSSFAENNNSNLRKVRAKRWHIEDKLNFVSSNVEVISVDTLIRTGDTVLICKNELFQYYIIQP